MSVESKTFGDAFSESDKSDRFEAAQRAKAFDGESGRDREGQENSAAPKRVQAIQQQLRPDYQAHHAESSAQC